jgi:sugar phosphate isomerase/epimerase
VILSLAPGAGYEVRTLADLDTYLGAIADAGFGGVSLGLQQVPADEAGGAALLLEAHGLTCTDVLALTITRDDELAMTTARRIRTLVDAVGAGYVLTMLWTRPSEESLDRLGRVADIIGVPLALEFGSTACATVDAANAIVDAIGTDKVRILSDAFHLNRAGSTLAMLEALPAERLAIVQWCDALPVVSDDYMTETMNRRAWPGEGELDLDAYRSILASKGWDGIVSVEVLSEELRKLPIADFAKQAYETTAASWR